MSGVQGSNLIRRKKHCHYGESVCMWKKRKILTAISIIHLQPILKEKREGPPKWDFYRLRKWIMGRVAWIKTDQFLRWWRVFFASVSRREAEAEAEKRRNRKKRWKRNERRSTEREREREKESEEEKEESGGGTQRGKWCSKKPASTLDWNLKVPGSIPGSTLREIIHPKTTAMLLLLPPP